MVPQAGPASGQPGLVSWSFPVFLRNTCCRVGRVGIPHASNSSEEMTVTQINKQTLRALAQQQRMCAETRLERWNRGMEFWLRWSAVLKAATQVRSHTLRKLGVAIYLSCLLGHPFSSVSLFLPLPQRVSDNSGLAMLDSKSSLSHGLSRHLCLLSAACEGNDDKGPQASSLLVPEVTARTRVLNRRGVLSPFWGVPGKKPVSSRTRHPVVGRTVCPTPDARHPLLEKQVSSATKADN